MEQCEGDGLTPDMGRNGQMVHRFNGSSPAPRRLLASTPEVETPRRGPCSCLYADAQNGESSFIKSLHIRTRHAAFVLWCIWIPPPLYLLAIVCYVRHKALPNRGCLSLQDEEALDRCTEKGLWCAPFHDRYPAFRIHVPLFKKHASSLHASPPQMINIIIMLFPELLRITGTF